MPLDKLVDMKMSKQEAKEQNSLSPGEEPRYPWGLRLDLGNESLDKLSMAMPAVGDKMLVYAMATVTSIHASESEGSEKHRSVGLQVTSLAVEPESESQSDAADRQATALFK